MVHIISRVILACLVFERVSLLLSSVGSFSSSHYFPGPSTLTLERDKGEAMLETFS
ncbi:hypothetical protein Scep_028250 [Stephania cephalantha]|uniref:Uncharacterized protein n=1 Tax=Stephania cephalantha TaxID=152367 RepID=A0AAP0EGX8_9MAGN